MSFEQFSLDGRIHAAIQAVGYTTPTPIQQQAMPILDRLAHGPRRKVRALVVAPTRELAEQTRQMSDDLGQNTRLRSVSIYGGVSKRPQVAALRRGAEIVVACPGRLLDLLGDGSIDLSNVEVLVLDEADRLCDMGFLPDIRRIIRQLPTRRQTLFFSATMPDDVRALSDRFLNDPQTVQIGMIAPAESVSHALYPVPHKLKKQLLLTLLSQTATGRVLIFTRTKYRARNLARDLKKRKYRAAALQGNMSQNQRQRAIDGFRDGKYDFLVATDVASRGIDVADITHVINFDMPDTVDAYTHRIGRTGRVDQTGDAFTFVTENDLHLVREIEKVLGTQIEKRRLPDFDYGDWTLKDAPRQRRANGSGRARSRRRRPRSGRRSSRSRARKK